MQIKSALLCEPQNVDGADHQGVAQPRCPRQRRTPEGLAITEQVLRHREAMRPTPMMPTRSFAVSFVVMRSRRYSPEA
jgi:hypothetical protein